MVKSPNRQIGWTKKECVDGVHQFPDAVFLLMIFPGPAFDANPADGFPA